MKRIIFSSIVGISVLNLGISALILPHQAQAQIPPLWGIDEDQNQLFYIDDYTNPTINNFTDYGSLRWNNGGTLETFGDIPNDNGNVESLTLTEDGTAYLAYVGDDNPFGFSGSNRFNDVLLSFKVQDAITQGKDNVVVNIIDVITSDISFTDFTGLSIHPTTGELYGVAKIGGNTTTDALFKINTTTAVATDLGFMTNGSDTVVDVEDMEFDANGNLYVTDNNGGDITYRIDHTNGNIDDVIDNDQDGGLGITGVKYEALGWDFGNDRMIFSEDDKDVLGQNTLENGNNVNYGDLTSLGLTDIEGIDFVPTANGQPVPFEFSPSLGLLISGVFFGFLQWKKLKPKPSGIDHS